ncbi:hypothetical protein [Pseudobacteriovorax antillogorgiicola]|uniref:Uncharacterized protein n=1 Tax=Pseudobacteriovorax antillogorgiicola TaxID=1513793 RepID=A0A1Y6CCQ0_9BACT|nr:hypothetical protein [Pseudobacteriovorax antillogorgiicola]TCS48270.1 hypothetical protein EDD56_11850 [Pseudobacteriovorax antillogorgiicola]SMF57093.1 hypothetical protein SAMN06296036_11891 [Pseudobacteriovorax antillogorgiicola]
MTSRIQQARYRQVFFALAGALLYSVWAFVINRQEASPWLSAVTEFLRSFLVTLSGNVLREFFFTIYRRWIASKLTRIILTAGTVYGLTTITTITIHYMINQDTAIQTASLPLIVSGIYSLAYLIYIARLEKI